MAQLVDLRVHAVADEAAVAGQRGRLVLDGAFDPAADVGEIVELADQAPDERRLTFAQQRTNAGDSGQRLAQADEVARPGRRQRHARRQPLQILDGLERLAQLAAIGRAKGQLLDGVEPVANRFERHQRAQQPATQQPAAHRR